MPDNNIPSYIQTNNTSDLAFNLDLDTDNRLAKIQSEIKLPDFTVTSSGPSTFYPNYKPSFDFENSKVNGGKTILESLGDPDENVRTKALLKFREDSSKNQLIQNDFGSPIVTDYKQSKRYLDEDYGFNPLRDNEDFYHSLNWDSKGFINKSLTLSKNLLGRVATGAVLKFGEGFGYIGSMVGNIGQDDYWGKVADNGFSKTLEEAEEYTKQEWFKVYKSANYDNKGFFGKMGDATFWQEDVADGLAFMASAMIPMGGLGKLGQAAKFGRLAILAEDLSSASKLGKALGTGLEFLTGSKNILGVTGHVYSVASEAAFEAADTYKKAIEQGYSKEEASEKASQTYIYNSAILTFSNAFENKLMQKVLNRGIENPGYKSAINFADDITINAEKAGTRLGKFFQDNTWGQRLSFYGKAAGKGFLAEGVWEENAQLAVQRMAEGEYEAKEVGTGKITKKKSGNFVEQYFTNIKDAALNNDIEAQTSIGIGGLIGIGGGGIMSIISRERRNKEKNTLNTITELTEARDNWLKNDIYVKGENGKIKYENGKPVIDPDKAIIRNRKLAELTSQLNMSKELQDNPELKSLVERKAFTDFALAHIKNDSIDFLIDKLNNWNTEDKETLAAYGFSQDLQEDISPKEFAQIAKDLKDLYSNTYSLKFSKPAGMSIKDAINIDYIAKRTILENKALLYNINNILENGFKSLEDIKFKDIKFYESQYRTALEAKDNPVLNTKDNALFIENSIKDAETVRNAWLKTGNNSVVGEEYVTIKTKQQELKATAEQLEKQIEYLSDKNEGLSRVDTEIKSIIESQPKEKEEKVELKSEKVSEKEVSIDSDLVKKFYEKFTKVKDSEDLKNVLNDFFNTKGSTYPADKVREKLLALYKKAVDVVESGKLTEIQQKEFESFIETLTIIGKKNNELKEKIDEAVDKKKLDDLIKAIEKRKETLASETLAPKIKMATIALRDALASYKKLTGKDYEEVKTELVVKIPSQNLISDPQRANKVYTQNFDELFEALNNNKESVYIKKVINTSATYTKNNNGSDDINTVTLELPSGVSLYKIYLKVNETDFKELGQLQYPNIMKYKVNGRDVTPLTMTYEEFKILSANNNLASLPKDFENLRNSYSKSLAVYEHLDSLNSDDYISIDNIDFITSLGEFSYTIDTPGISFETLDQTTKVIGFYDLRRNSKGELDPIFTRNSNQIITEDDERNFMSKDRNLDEIRSSIGRYVAVIENNGKYAFVELKTPSLEKEELNSFISSLKTSLDKIQYAVGDSLSVADSPELQDQIRDIQSEFNNIEQPFIALNQTNQIFTEVRLGVLFVETRGPSLQIEITPLVKDAKPKKINIPYNKDMSNEDIINIINEKLGITENNYQININQNISFSEALTKFGTNLTEKIFKNRTIKYKLKEEHPALTKIIQTPVKKEELPTLSNQSDIEAKKADIERRRPEELDNVKPVYHHTQVKPEEFNFSSFQRGSQSISQFGDGLNASSNTTSFLVNRYGKPIQGEVNDKEFVEIDANKTEKEIYEYLKAKGYKFSQPASEYISNEKANDQPAIIELFQDFQKSNPGVKGVKISNHIIGGNNVAPFYVIYDSKSFYGQGALSKKIEQESNAELKALEEQSTSNQSDIEKVIRSKKDKPEITIKRTPVKRGRNNSDSVASIVPTSLVKQDVDDIVVFQNWLNKNLPSDLFTINKWVNPGKTLINNNVKVGQFVTYLNSLNEVKGEISYYGNKAKYHEAFHGIFRLLLSNQEQNNLINAAYKYIYKELETKKTSLVEELNIFKKLDSSRSSLSKEELKNLYAEEWLADKFQEFKDSTKDDSVITKFFKNLWNFIKNIFSSNEIDQFFYDVDSSKFKGSVVKENDFTKTVLENGWIRPVNKIELNVTDAEVNINGEKVDTTYSEYLPESHTRLLVGTIFNNFIKQAANKKTNKNKLLDEILDSIYNKWKTVFDMYSEYRVSDKHEDVFSTYSVSDIHRLGLYTSMLDSDITNEFAQDVRSQLKEEVNTLLEYLGFTQDLEDEELIDYVDDNGDRKTTDNFSDSENFGGFKSASKEFRKYLMTFSKESSDIFEVPYASDQDVTFYESPNIPVLYNGLLKATSNAGAIDEKIFLKQLVAFSQYNKEVKIFVNKLLEDIGLDIDNIDYDNLVIKDTTLFNLVKSTLQTFRIDYKLFESDVSSDKKITRILNANSRNSSKLQLELWHNNFKRLFQRTNVKDLKVSFNSLKSLIEGSRPIVSKQDTQNYSVELSQNIFKDSGILLSPLYIEYSYYSNKYRLEQMIFDNLNGDLTGFVDTLPLYAKELISLYQDIVPLDIENINEIVRSIDRGENPFLSGKEIEDENDDNYGAKSRIYEMAHNNSYFDENVWGSVFKNAENNNVWQHQHPTFTLTKFEKIKQHYKNSKDPYNKKLLSKDKTFLSILDNIKVERISGLTLKVLSKSKEGEYYASSKLETNKKDGITYGKFKSSEMYHTLNALYFGGKSYYNKALKKNVSTAYSLLRIYEASNTGDILQLPVTKAVNIKDKNLTISDDILEKLFTLFLEETNTNKYLLFENFTKQSLLVNKLQELASTSNNKLTSSEISESKEGIKKELNGYFLSVFDEYYQDLFKEGLIGRDEKDNIINFLLPSEVFGKISEEKNISHINNLFLNIKQNLTELELKQNIKPDLTELELKQNLAQIFFTDFINTTLFNDLLHEQPQSKIYKHYVDLIKRAKGFNAGGTALRSETINPEVGINHPFTSIKSIVLKEQKHNSTISGEDRSLADGQSWGTVKHIRYIFNSLGRLDRSTSEILDRIASGEESIDDVFGENGLISFNRQTSVLKIVYFDGEHYFKTSMVVLAPKFTSSLNDKGEWVALPHRKELHDLRLKLEEHESTTDSVVLVLDKSSSKLGSETHYDSMEDLVNSSEMKYTEKDTSYYRLQTENPSNKNEIINPSQMKQVLDSEQNESFVIPFINKTVGEIGNLFRSALGQKNKIKHIIARNNLFDFNEVDLKDELSISINKNKISPKLDNFRKVAVETLTTTGASNNLLTYFKDGDYNLNSPLTREKFEQLFLAYFNNNGFKDKVPGHAGTLASSLNVRVYKKAIIRNFNGKRVVEWEVIPTHTIQNSIKKGETTYLETVYKYDSKKSLDRSFLNDLNDGDYFIDELQYNVPIYDNMGNIISHYSEAVMPAHFKEIEFNLRKGKNIPKNILKAFGVRIPSQDKHSAASIRFVDFAPAHMGSTIFVPDEILEISGADFDVDKLYLQITDFYSKYDRVNNSYEFIEYGEASNMETRFEEFKKWNFKNNSLLKSNRKLNFKSWSRDISSLKNEIKSLKDERYDYEEEVFNEVQSLYDNDQDDKADLLSDFWDNQMLKDFEDHGKLLKDTKEYLKNIFGIELAELDDEVKEEIRNKQTRLNEIYDLIQKQSLLDSNLPSTIDEYVDFFTKNGESNIGVLNNQLLSTKILLLTNKDIIDRGIDKETAEAEYFLKEVKTDEILSQHLRKESNVEVDHFLGKKSHQEANKSGANNIGPAVNSMLISFFLKKNKDFRLVKNIPIIDGLEYDNYNNMSTSSAPNSPSKRVFKLVSEVVTLMTDNAKERAAYKNNLSMQTIPVFVHGISLGINQRLMQALLLRPSVKEYTSKIETLNKTLKITDYQSSDKSSIKADILNKYSEDLTDEELLDLKAEDFLNFDKNAKATEYKLLNLYLNLEDQSTQLSKLINIIKLTKGLNEGFTSIYKLKQALDELGIIEYNDFEDERPLPLFKGIKEAVNNNPILRNSYRQALQIDDLSEITVLSQTKPFKKLINGSLKQMSIPSYTRKDFFKNYVNDFISYLSTVAYIKLGEKAKKEKPNGIFVTNYLNNDLLTGENNIIKYTEEARKAYRNVYGEKSKMLEHFFVTNPAYFNKTKTVKINGVDTLVTELVKNSNNNSGFNLLDGNSYSKLDEVESNDMDAEFNKMYSATLPEDDDTNRDQKLKDAITLQKYARVLYAYLIVKDGHQFKSKGISQVIPAHITKSFTKRLDYINDLFRNKFTDDIASFNIETNIDFVNLFGKDFLSLLTEFNRMFLTHPSNTNKVRKIKKTLEKDKAPRTIDSVNDGIIVDLFGGLPQKNESNTEEFNQKFVNNIESLVKKGFYLKKDKDNNKTKIVFPLVITSGSNEYKKYYILEHIGKRVRSGETITKLDSESLSNLNDYYDNNLDLVGTKATYRVLNLTGFEQQTSIGALFGEHTSKPVVKDEVSNSESLPVSTQGEIIEGPKKPENVVLNNVYTPARVSALKMTATVNRMRANKQGRTDLIPIIESEIKKLDSISKFLLENKLESITEEEVLTKIPEFEVIIKDEILEDYSQSTGSTLGTQKNNELFDTSLPKINIYAGTGENAELSNFAVRPFKYNTKTFPRETIEFQSVEQAFQFMKLSYSPTSVKNESVANKILETTNGKTLRNLGKDFDMKKDNSWDRNSSRIMKELLLESFKQNPEALERLLATGNTELTHIQDKGKWGKEFPKLLMEVRQELKPNIEKDTYVDSTTKIQRKTC